MASIRILVETISLITSSLTSIPRALLRNAERSVWEIDQWPDGCKTSPTLRAPGWFTMMSCFHPSWTLTVKVDALPMRFCPHGNPSVTTVIV